MRWLAAGLAAALLAAPAAAAAPAWDGYLELKPGLMRPQGDMGAAPFKADGPAPAVAVGARRGHFAVETSVGFFHASYHYFREPSGRDANLEVVPFDATFLGVASAGPVDFHAGVGGGWDHATLQDEQKVSGKGFKMRATDMSVGTYHFAGGANVNVTRRLFLGVEAKFVGTEKARFRGYLGIPETVTMNLNRTIYAAVLGWRLAPQAP